MEIIGLSKLLMISPNEINVIDNPNAWRMWNEAKEFLSSPEFIDIAIKTPIIKI